MYQNHRLYYHFHRYSMQNDKIGLFICGIDTGLINLTMYFCIHKIDN